MPLKSTGNTTSEPHVHWPLLAAGNAWGGDKANRGTHTHLHCLGPDLVLLKAQVCPRWQIADADGPSLSRSVPRALEHSTSKRTPEKAHRPPETQNVTRTTATRVEVCQRKKGSGGFAPVAQLCPQEAKLTLRLRSCVLTLTRTTGKPR